MDFNEIKNLLGSEADNLLNHTCTGIPKDMIHAPGPDYIDRRKEAVVLVQNGYAKLVFIPGHYILLSNTTKT